MKRLIFVLGTSVPAGMVFAWALGPMSFRTVNAVIVAVILGYVWGITAPEHMQHPIGE